MPMEDVSELPAYSNFKNTTNYGEMAQMRLQEWEKPIRKCNMTFYTALLIIALIVLVSMARSQKINVVDLKGSFCTIGLSNMEYFLIFQDSSNFYFSSKSSEFGNQEGTYSLKEINGEIILTLKVLPGLKKCRKIEFMIRNNDPKSYLLQMPKKKPSGEIIYKWENNKSKNDYRLYVNKKNIPG